MQYTIEKHLASLSETDENIKLIYSIWNLNKNNLKKALSSIQITFPHYSIHDYSHADTIIKNIELFLGPERIGSLSPTDSWLILMSAYTHDIGMVVFMKDLEARMSAPEFLDDLKNKSRSRNDKDLADAAKVILKLLKVSDSKDALQQEEELPINYALNIKKAITLLSAELFRKIHHEKSKEILTGINESFYNEFNKFYSPDIPIRFMQTLGDIAYAHGISLYNTLELLPVKSNGYCSDYMHPRFIACLLRLGDLLDVDDKRFNQFAINIFDKKNNKTSELHEKKHASIRHLLVTPESIEVTVDCREDEDVFRIANQWFDWLKDEVDKQNREWHRIRPNNFPGLAPTISRNKVQVLFNGKEVDAGIVNLQFNISKEKVFDIFEGSALYEDPSFVFLREIVQNAVDATKIQLWKDINKGVYDSFLKENISKLHGIETNEWSHDHIIFNIKFPQDIPDSVYANYRCILNIDWEDVDKKVLLISISDKGCGINRETLLRMTNNVGDSRKNDIEYQKLKQSLPFFLKPTGAFGLGLQSIFIVADEFEILTKSDSDTGWNITFRSAKHDEYISVQPVEHLLTTGSKLSIRIPYDKFDEVFVSSFDVDIVNQYDPLVDKEVGSPFVLNMIAFIDKELISQQFLDVKILGKNIIKSNGNSCNNYFINTIKKGDISLVTTEIDLANNISISLYKSDSNQSIFHIFEYLNKQLGSEIILCFYPNFLNNHQASSYIQTPAFGDLFSVRNINISSRRGYYYTPYSSTKINLLNDDSDKLLNISRSKIINKAEDDLYEKVDSSIKKIILEIKSLFESKYDSLDFDFDSTATIYFHLCLTYASNPLIDSSCILQKEILKEFVLPESIICQYNNSFTEPQSIKAVEFFSCNSFILQKVSNSQLSRYVKDEETRTRSREFTMEECKLTFIDIAQNNKYQFDNIPIVWHELYFRLFFNKYYYVSEIYIDNTHPELLALKLNRRNGTEYINVQLDDSKRKHFFCAFFTGKGLFRFEETRTIFYPIEPYADMLSVHTLVPNSFYIPPNYSTHWILSPFRSLQECFEIIKLEEFTTKTSHATIKKIITEKYIHSLVNETLINHVINSNPFSNIHRNAASIKEVYTDLIVEIICSFFI